MPQPNIDGGTSPAAPPIITADLGHGGRDPGAVGPTNLFEKDVCLAVGLRLRTILRGEIDVRLTRDTDVNLSFEQRMASPGSRAYVSIHCNAHTTRTANGTETFWRLGGVMAPASSRLATLLQRQLIEALQRRNRGVKTANFRVLAQATVPTALVELAFISHPEEEALLRSPDTHEKAAQAIARALREFLL